MFEKTGTALANNGVFIARAQELLHEIAAIRVPKDVPAALLNREIALANRIRQLKQELAVSLLIDCNKALQQAQESVVAEIQALPPVTDPPEVVVTMDAEPPSR